VRKNEKNLVIFRWPLRYNALSICVGIAHFRLKVVNLTKTDDVLLELNRAFDAYLKSFFSFEYENKTYRLVNSYVALPWARCDVCGSYPIKEVAVIRSRDGQELRVCNGCIDRITNRKTSEWFKKFRTKRENIISNRKYIDGLSSILTAYGNSELPSQISKNEVERLQKAFEQMCNGFSLNRKQMQLIDCYLKIKTDV
jgi:hypothetical protein